MNLDDADLPIYLTHQMVQFASWYGTAILEAHSGRLKLLFAFQHIDKRYR